MKPHAGFIWVKVLTGFSENNTGPALQNNKQFFESGDCKSSQAHSVASLLLSQ